MEEVQHAPQTKPAANFMALASEIVSAFVSNNSVPPNELPMLISVVHDALGKIALGKIEKPVPEHREPAVPIKKSVTPDYIISLEDGKKLKSLKRHLMTSYGLTPDAYRARWGLDPKYPMIAPNYAAQRSALAKQSGLGDKRRSTPLPNGFAVKEVSGPVKRGRPSKGTNKTDQM